MFGLSSSSSGRFSFNNSDNWNSNSNVSSHLCELKNINIADLASWQKTTIFPKGVGISGKNDFLKAKEL